MTQTPKARRPLLIVWWGFVVGAFYWLYKDPVVGGKVVGIVFCLGLAVLGVVIMIRKYKNHKQIK